MPEGGARGIQKGPIIGLFGVLVATIAVGFNDQVVAAALPDVRGAYGLSYDQGRWVGTLFAVAQVFGMSVAPQLGKGFSLRAFTLAVIAANFVVALILPALSTPAQVLVFRTIQGLLAGLTYPLLMTVALKVLPPDIKLWGLAAYSLSVTFSPALAPSLAALWIDGAHAWPMVFLQVLPLDVLAFVLVLTGMEKEPRDQEVLSALDWPGAFLVLVGFGSLVIVLEQGDWLDWFNSDAVCALSVVAAIAIPLFFVRQALAAQPLFKLDLLKRRNFTYALLGVVGFIVLQQSANQIPFAYLGDVHDYKPLQSHLLTLLIAATQLAFLPLSVKILENRKVDPRWVSTAGYVLILTACAWDGFLANNWLRQQFAMQQLLQSLGFSFVVMPLLMMGTNVIEPQEGLQASSMFNTSRALALSLAACVVDLIRRWRGTLHRDRLIDIIGHVRLNSVQAVALPGSEPRALTPQRTERIPGSLGVLYDQVAREVSVLTSIDAFLILGLLAIGMTCVLWLVAERTLPPHIALKK